MTPTWLQEFKRPINIVFLLISAISLALGILSLSTTRAPRKISYIISIHDLMSHNPGSIPVGLFDEAGRAIDGDVYFAQMSFWNSGSSAIGSPDMHRALRYELFDQGRIIAVEKLAESGPSVTNMRAIMESEKSVRFDWDNLDLKMGAKFQVVFISFDRRHRIGLLSIFSMAKSAIWKIGFTSDLTGFIREGELIDAQGAARSLMGVSFIAVFTSGAAMILILVVRMMLGTGPHMRAQVLLSKVQSYVLIPVVLSILMALAGLLYLLFLIISYKSSWRPHRLGVVVS
jgi:hypothetical protein